VKLFISGKYGCVLAHKMWPADRLADDQGEWTVTWDTYVGM